MNDRFEQILQKQEIEDDVSVEKEAVLMAKFQQEYVNYEEILHHIATLNLTPKDALSLALDDKNYDFLGSVVPIRREDDFAIRKHTSSQVPYWHSHIFYELIFVLKGSCVQTIDKDLTKMEIKSGQACLILPPTKHNLEKIKKDEIIFKFHIPAHIFNACYPAEIDASKPYIFYGNTTELAKSYVVKLLDEYHNKNKFSQVAINNYLSLLFIELERPKVEYDDDLIVALNKYLEVNYRMATLSEFAKTVGYNAVYVGKVVKRVTGQSFSTILGAYKLKAVVALLVDTDMTIADIAIEVGYVNTTGLYKSFRKAFGVTPLEYRLSIIK